LWLHRPGLPIIRIILVHLQVNIVYIVGIVVREIQVVGFNLDMQCYC